MLGFWIVEIENLALEMNQNNFSSITSCVDFVGSPWLDNQIEQN